MRTVYGDHQRFIDTYFTTYPGKYFTGDGCRRDEDGYYWITGRVDDVINVSGHRIGTAEVESALVGHADVAEAAVVGYPARHQGPGHLCLCHAEGRRRARPTTCARNWSPGCARRSAPSPRPTCIQWAPGLPKTRSGKIMRRILRKIAENDLGNLGDTSTLADPGGGRRSGEEPRAVSIKEPDGQPDDPATRRGPGRRPHHLAHAHRGGARPHRGSPGRRPARLHQGVARPGAGCRRRQRRPAPRRPGAVAAGRPPGLDQEPVRRRRRDHAGRARRRSTTRRRRRTTRRWSHACAPPAR